MDSPVEIIDLTRSKSRSVPPEPDVIPPCRVCGEKASGLHYGKITCHGCKGFFRRSLTRRDKYTCKQGNNRCGISRAVEVKLCQYCRFQRCLAVGMSKQAIRSGRYTYAMRTKNLQEARGLDNTELSTTATTRLTPASSDSRDSGLGSPPLLSILSTDLESDSVVSTLNSDPSSTRSLSERDKEFELEKVITNITDCHKMFSDNAHLIENSDELQAQQERFYELAKLKETMFGELKALSRAEYRDFFQVTGIDVDDRRKTTLEFMEYMQRHIMGQVEFAKRIQGFADIPLVDQCSLIKGSFYEMSLFDGHRTYNSDLDVKVLHDGMAFQPQEICFLDNYVLWSERKEFEKSLNTMQLDVTETALIKAIVLLFTDRRPLDVPIYVENLQLNIINAFRHYLRRTNSNFNKRFANIWSKITHVRTISLLHEEARRNCMMDFPEIKRLARVSYNFHQINSILGQLLLPSRELCPLASLFDLCKRWAKGEQSRASASTSKAKQRQSQPPCPAFVFPPPHTDVFVIASSGESSPVPSLQSACHGVIMRCVPKSDVKLLPLPSKLKRFLCYQLEK